MLRETVRNERTYFHFPRLASRSGLGHAFSSRDLNVRDARDRETFCQDQQIDPLGLHFQQQIHKPGVAVVETDTPVGPLPETDASILTAEGRAVLAFSADCPLVLIHDARQRVLAVAHASWRCMVANLVEKVVQQMQSDFNSRPEDLAGGIGPSAGPEAYEVGEDVYEAAAHLPERDRIFRPHGDRWLLDLWTGNRVQLERCGVPPGAIEIAGRCTMSEPDTFFSYRREGVGCGHFGLLAWHAV